MIIKLNDRPLIALISVDSGEVRRHWKSIDFDILSSSGFGARPT